MTSGYEGQESEEKGEEYDEELEQEGVVDPIIQTHINEDGTTSNYFDKRKLKIAPRSTLQFKVGPPFELIGSYHNVTETNSSEKVSFQIIPRIDRGFDFIDDEWVGYKRNYFTLVSSFEAPGWELEAFLNSSFQVHMENGHKTQTCKVKYFAIKIKARSDDDFTEINLVQHTAKRDKGPQFSPATCPLIPASLPQHQVIREASNVRNTNKMKKYDSTFYFHRDQEKQKYPADGLVFSYPNECIQKVARYERVQFASSINVKKPTQQNRHFRLHVILGAVVSYPSNHSNTYNRYSSSGIGDEVVLLDGTKEIFIPLQEMRTLPLIIRGRSPSNYTSSQRVAMKSTCSPFGEEKKNSSTCIAGLNPTLICQSSASTELFSPVKQKAGRPSKRKSKVVETACPSFESMKDATNNSSNIERRSERAETLEQIERFFHDEIPLTLRTSNEANKCRLEYKCMSDSLKRPSISRHNSIDPREIEMKPSQHVRDENIFVVGSLALTATLKSQKLDRNTKRRRINEETTAKAATAVGKKTKSKLAVPDNPLLSSSTPPSPTSPVSKSHDPNPFEESFTNELNPISLSILEDSSTNYCHIANSIHSDVEAVPRAFSRVIGEESFTNLYSEPANHDKYLMTDNSRNSVAVNLLPSQLVDVGEFYDELSFYKH